MNKLNTKKERNNNNEKKKKSNSRELWELSGTKRTNAKTFMENENYLIQRAAELTKTI